MMRVVLALGLAVASARVVYQKAQNRTTTEEDYWKQWTDFLKQEAMVFETHSHHNERFEIFRDNIDKINRHNALGLSWKMGVTPFAHLTAEEFKEQIVGGCTLPKKDDSNVELLKTDNLPDSIDWVTQGKVSPVKNQGQCGSCWAFSTTGSIESRYAIANKKTPDVLSEQELVDCAGAEGNNGCNGGLMDYGFEYVEQEHGLCSEGRYPYVAKTKKLECASMRSECGTREDAISSHKDVQPKSEDQLKAAVAEGPVSVAIEADQESFQLYKSGVLTSRCGKRLDHGVLAVGYGEDSTGNAYWKVKNSWGANWGMEGYILLCRNCNKNMGAGQCGICGQPSYPVV